MNEYKNHQEKTTVANEAWVAYNAHLTDTGKMPVLGSALMFLDTNQPRKQVRIASSRVIKKDFYFSDIPVLDPVEFIAESRI